MKNERHPKPRLIITYIGLTLLLTLLQQYPLLTYAAKKQPLEEHAPATVPPPALSSPDIAPLPPLPPIPEENPPLSTIDKIFVKQFRFEGNHVLSSDELSQITAAYENRDISAEELQEVKNAITRYYIDKGYINSGAIIPDQQVQDGIISLKIIEGRLVKVDISGNKNLRTAYLKKRLEGSPNQVLNINELQERLQLIQQNPLLKRIDAKLGPGVNLGEGILSMAVEEARPYVLGVRFNNHRSPSVGAYRGEVEFQHRNLTGLFGHQMGWGDRLYLRYGLTEGLSDYTVNYSFPINRHDTLLSFEMERSDSEVIEEPFNRIDVESEADTYAVSLHHPLYKTTSRELSIGLKLEKRSSETFLLGRPFSFSAGVNDGKSDITVIRFSQDWLDRSRVHVVAARSTLNVGVDAFDATINEDGSPDSEFFSWLGQFQWVRRLDFLEQPVLKDSHVLFRVDLQWAEQSLLPLEKLSIGGASTVRGYRENQLTRDSGLIASLEWRIPIMQWRVAKLSKNPDDGMLYLAPFIDYGRSWHEETLASGSKDDYIYSAGLGLRWDPSAKIHTELYWGETLHDEVVSEPTDKDLQDDGVHFEISLEF